MSSKLKDMESGINRAILWFCISILINFSHGKQDCEVAGVRRVPVKVQLPSVPLVESSPGVKPGGVIAGERVCIPGLKRFQNLKKYAHSRRVRVQYSEGLSKSYPKIELCLHRNATLGLVQCRQHEWKSLEKGLWTGVMSPYETIFIDIRMPDTLFGSLTFSVEEEFQQYRLVFLGVALLMLFLAPILSKWVPFYYSSAMAFGVIVVILIIIFQGMKMLPTGRKSSLYLLLYGSVVGLGSVILHYISGLVHSVLQEFGFGEELINPVAGILLLCVVLAGAGLGYWGVRKLVLSEDGAVDRGTSLFVAFAIRIVAATMIFESSCDSLLSLLMVIVGAFITFWTHILDYFLHMQPTFFHSKERDKSFRSKKHSSRWANNPYMNSHQAQFLSRLPKEDADLLKSQTALKWGSYNPQIAGSSLPERKNTPSPVSYTSGSSVAASFKTPSPLSHMAGSSMVRHTNTPSSYSDFDEQEYYSTFHETPVRKHFTKEGWEDFTKLSTRKALRELASSPEFTEWTLNNADRIMLSPAGSKKDSYYTDSDSKDSTEEENSSGGGWFW